MVGWREASPSADLCRHRDDLFYICLSFFSYFLNCLHIYRSMRLLIVCMIGTRIFQRINK